MALKLADRIKENSNTTGTGPFHMNGAVAGFQTAASALADGDQAYFAATDNASTWVVFLGTFTLAGNLVTVNTVLASSPGYAGFTTAPTIWIDAPAALLSKLLSIMPSNDNIVGVNLTQTLANKTFTPTVIISGVSPNIFTNSQLGILLTRAGDNSVQPNMVGVGDSSTYSANSNGTQYTSFFATPTVVAGPVGNLLTFESIVNVSQPSGAISNVYGFYSTYSVKNAGATITNRYGLFIGDDSGSLGTVGGNIGIYVNTLTRGSAGNIWAIYTSGSTPTYHSGPVAIGDDPTIIPQPSTILGMARNQNSGLVTRFSNKNTGNAAFASYNADNGPHQLQMGITGTGYTATALISPDQVFIIDGSAANGIVIATQAGTPIKFGLNGTIMGQLVYAGPGGYFQWDAQQSNLMGFLLKNSAGGTTAQLRMGVATQASSLINRDVQNDIDIYNTSGGNINFSTDNGNTLPFQIYANATGVCVWRSGAWPTVDLSRQGIGTWHLTADSANHYFQIVLNAITCFQMDSAGNAAFGGPAPSTGNSRLYFTTNGSNYGLRVDQAASSTGVPLQTVVQATSSQAHHYFNNPNGVVGQITTNASATAYLTSSDLRLKKNVKPAGDSGKLIDAIEVDQFDWLAEGGGHESFGIVAQKLHAHYPNAVMQGRDDDDELMAAPWMIDHSKLVPLLLAEIKSLRQRMAKQETRH